MVQVKEFCDKGREGGNGGFGEVFVAVASIGVCGWWRGRRNERERRGEWEVRGNMEKEESMRGDKTWIKEIRLTWRGIGEEQH